MAFESDTSIHVIPPHRLKPRQTKAIQTLVARSIAADFPNRTPKEHSYFVAHNTIGNPNKGVGGPLLRTNQAYANVHNILVVRNDEPIVHLPMADNASSRKPFLAGAAEIQAKLHLPEMFGRDFPRHRYVWTGYVAMANQVRQEIIASEGQAFTELDLAVLRGLDHHDDEQPMTNYPWDEEEALKVWLPSVGLDIQPGQDRGNIQAFGPSAAPVHQDRALAESVLDTTEMIQNKEGAAKIMGGLAIKH